MGTKKHRERQRGTEKKYTEGGKEKGTGREMHGERGKERGTERERQERQRGRAREAERERERHRIKKQEGGVAGGDQDALCLGGDGVRAKEEG